VGRTPIGEALSRLAAEGLVELSPNRGARVANWTSEELREIFEVRLRLEPYAVSQAIPRLSPAELDELCGLAQSMLALGRDQATARSGHQDRGVDTPVFSPGGDAASPPGNVGGVR
jgi:DNA-binding GntR family transcriptional regulator